MLVSSALVALNHFTRFATNPPVKTYSALVTRSVIGCLVSLDGWRRACVIWQCAGGGLLILKLARTSRCVDAALLIVNPLPDSLKDLAIRFDGGGSWVSLSEVRFPLGPLLWCRLDNRLSPA